jgi:hypothetical protein
MLLLLACAHVRPVDVTLLGATVGPSAADGSAWDGVGTVPADVRASAIAAASSVDPAVGVAAAAFGSFLDGVAPPDPAGTMWVEGGDPAARVDLAEQADTFQPRWSDATLRSVLLGTNQWLTIRLVDNDLDSPDPIAVIKLDDARLREAARAKGPWTLDTVEGTGGQLLSVTLAVTTSGRGGVSPPSDPGTRR